MIYFVIHTRKRKTMLGMTDNVSICDRFNGANAVLEAAIITNFKNKI